MMTLVLFGCIPAVFDDNAFCFPAQDMLMTLSTLLRGSIYEKLRWTFKLYDLNGDGCITRSELGQIVLAIHELMGKRPQVRTVGSPHRRPF